MTVTQTLQAELDRLGEFRGSPQSVSFRCDTATVELELLELNSLACAFDSLRVTDAALASADTQKLRSLSDQLCARLTYLLEPIQPIEFDAEQQSVQLRSSPPTVAENETSYYELLVRRPGQITLTRFAKAPGECRRTIPAEVTRAVLGRLVTDLCGASRL